VSADNWADCPRCELRAQKKYEADLEALNDMYGKVSLDLFRKAQRACVKEEHAVSTFREDYEIYGAEDGVVKISYSGECTECGLGLNFQRHIEIEGINE
jgi:hypothetical protein